MKINWFTVIAQILNFLVLVWLLKKFLYKPVLDAIDAREKKITARLEDAKHKKEEAKKEQDEFAEKNTQFDAQKKKLMDDAVADTKSQKDKLLEEAKKEVDALRAKQEGAIKDMQQNLKTAITQKIQSQVFDISRKALTAMASADLEEEATKLFISRLDALTPDEEKQFVDAFNGDPKVPASKHGPVLIQSAFELPKKQQTEIKKAVDKILGKETVFGFTIVPALISGIELSANGYKLSWSISAYLDSFENEVAKSLKEDVDADADKKAATVKKAEPEQKPQSK